MSVTKTKTAAKKTAPPSRAPESETPDGAAPQENFKYVHSLARGLAVMMIFDEQHRELTLADVARAAKLDRSTARRFLLTLKSLGFIEQNDRYFSLTPRTLQLGYGYLASLPWWRAAQSISEKLTSDIRVSSAVGVLDKESIVYVAYASAGRFPQLMSRSVGTHLPAVATAIGRVLLAERDPAEIKGQLSAMTIEKYTPLTRTHAADIERILDEVRRDGFCLVDQELETGLRSLGVPVRNRAGEAVAGLSVSLLQAQFTNERIIETYLPALQAASKEITQSLPA